MPPSAPTLRAPSVASAVGLVVANVVPLVGVVWFGWDLFGVMWLYWAENGVIGAFAVLRILGAREGAPSSKAAMAPFFVVHFGLFWTVHGAFVADLFGDRGDAGVAARLLTDVPVEGLVLLVLSHGASFALNYVAGGEWRAAAAGSEMAKPYGRVILLHVVIIAGGFAVAATGAGAAALALLVALKTAVDLGVHLAGHRWRYRALAVAEADPEATTRRLGRHPTRGAPGARASGRA